MSSATAEFTVRPGTETYHGKPCRHCGETLRYRSGATCIACSRKRSRAGQEAHPERHNTYLRRSWLRRHYGLALEEYDAMVERQDGKCAICGTDDPSPHRYLSVDHDHETGKPRGLLCNRCNVGIGRFGDDLDLLREAVAYLEAHQC